MIIRFIMDSFLFLPTLVLRAFSNLDFSFANPSDIHMFGLLLEPLIIIGYLFPVTSLLPIILFIITLDFIQIAIAIIIRAKSIIPTMGA